MLEIGRQNRSAIYDLNVTRPQAAGAARGPAGRARAAHARRRRDRRARRARASRARSRRCASAGSERSRSACCTPTSTARTSAPIGDGAARRDPGRRGVAVVGDRPAVPRVRALLDDRRQRGAARRSCRRISTASRAACARPACSAPIFVMRSDGGMAALKSASRRPATLIESGPASGVIGAAYLGRALGIANVLSFDMGGTTAKAGTIFDGVPRDQRVVRSGRRRRTAAGPSRAAAIRCAFRSSTWPRSARAAGRSPGSTRPGRCASARSRPAPIPVRRATATAIVRPSPTRTSCCGGSNPRALLDGAFPIDADALARRDRVGRGAGRRRRRARRGRDRHAGRRRDGEGAADRLGRARPRSARLHAARVRRRRTAARLRGRRRHRRRARRRPAARPACSRPTACWRPTCASPRCVRSSRRPTTPRRGSARASCSTRSRAKATPRSASRASRRPTAASCASSICATSANRPSWSSPRRARSTKRSKRSTSGTSSATASRRATIRSRSSPRASIGIGTTPKPRLVAAAAPARRAPEAARAARAARRLRRHGVRRHAGVRARALLRPGDAFDGPAVVEQYDATTYVAPGWTARVDGFGNLVMEHAR